MLFGIMKFLDREDELDRLDRLALRRDGGLAVVYGRRRIGKTKLLEVVRALFVPEPSRGLQVRIDDVFLVTSSDLID